MSCSLLVPCERLGARTVLYSPQPRHHELTLATTAAARASALLWAAWPTSHGLAVRRLYCQNMRFVTRMTNQAAMPSSRICGSSTWEDARGKRFRFDSSQYATRRQPTARSATRPRPGATKISRSTAKPAKKTFPSPAAWYFPVQHTIALLHAAKTHQDVFRADLYDGSRRGEKVYDTVAASPCPGAGSNRQLAQVKNARRLV